MPVGMLKAGLTVLKDTISSIRRFPTREMADAEPNYRIPSGKSKHDKARILYTCQFRLKKCQKTVCFPSAEPAKRRKKHNWH